MPELGQRTGLDRLSQPDDRDPVAESLDLGQDVAGQEHRPSAAPFLLNALLEDLSHQRVEPRGRLVQQQQLDVGSKRGDQPDLLLVTLGVRPSLLPRVEVEPL